MGKLVFVGLGLGSKGITIEGIEAIKESKKAYLEYYTSPHEATLLQELTKLTGKELIIVGREFVEDGRQILEEALNNCVAIAVPGDPMIATTHSELRVRAMKKGIETKIIHSASIASAALSISGLHFYKLGGAITATRETLSSMQQLYTTIHRNLLFGRHTMVLLEYDVSAGKGAEPQDVFKSLMRVEENYKKKVVGEDTFALVLSRIGRKDSELHAGKLKNLLERNYGEHPHCIIIPGSLHFTEREAISVIFSIDEKDILDNSSNVKRTAQILLPRYLEKTRKVIDSVKKKVGNEYSLLLENAELYSNDAEKFLQEGEDELAMLSIGYAEGLIDSLNYTGVVKIEW
jgi:diphthine synthase